MPQLPDLKILSAPALFLDFDGTLVDIVARPDLTRVTPDLLTQLAQLHSALNGAMAIVTGRPLADLDRLLAPLVLPAAGIHGIEHRQQDETIETRIEEKVPDSIRRQMHALAGTDPRLILEDKQFGFSLHYREAPELEASLRDQFSLICADLDPLFSVQNGKMVLELKPHGIDKGSAIEKFMAQSPFAGRKPVFIGDDLTDEDGFRVVNQKHGFSARVGHSSTRTLAQYSLKDVAAVRAWLAALS